MNPLWLLAAHLHRSLAQAPKACTRESVLHNALCIAEPRVDDGHRPVYGLSCYVLDPQSLRSLPVDYRPPALASGVPQANASVALPPGSIRLTEPERGLLGNLPPQAQQYLQTPFLQGEKILRCEWYYEGSEHQLDMFMFYLAGHKDVTLACGTKTVPIGHSDETAHWTLRIYRATVVRRIGK